MGEVRLAIAFNERIEYFMNLLTPEQRAALKAKAAPHHQTPPRASTSGRARWLNLLETFRTMLPDTDRPNTLLALVREGTWLEMRGQLPAGQSVERITQAAYDNGFIGLHGLSRITDTVACTVPWARDHHMWGDGNAGRSTPTKPNTTLVTHPIHQYVQAVYESALPDNIKRMIYTAAARQIQHPDWDYLVISNRAIAAAAHVSMPKAGQYWRQAEKHGFITFSPGVDYETAKLLGVPSKSSVITLNLEIYPDRPVRKPAVDIRDYMNAADNITGYAKHRRQVERAEKHAYLVDTDTSTAKARQEPTERPAASVSFSDWMSNVLDGD